MFAIGVGVILVGFAIGIKWGLPGVKFNWADHLMNWCVNLGSGICTASLLIWLWRILP
jgi:hypothetical protein